MYQDPSAKRVELIMQLHEFKRLLEIRKKDGDSAVVKADLRYVEPLPPTTMGKGPYVLLSLDH